MWVYFPRVIIMRGIYSHVKQMPHENHAADALSCLKLIEINLFLLIKKH